MQDMAVLVSQLVAAITYLIQFKWQSDCVGTGKPTGPEEARFAELLEVTRRSGLIGEVETIILERVRETLDDQPPDVRQVFLRLVRLIESIVSSDETLLRASEHRRRAYPGVLERGGSSEGTA